MTNRHLPALRELPREYRMLAALVMLTLAIGYAHAVGYVYLTTHMIPKGIEERYRGTESMAPRVLADSAIPANAPLASSEEAELSNGAITPTADTVKPTKTVTGDMQYEKSLAELLNLIHTHILTMTFIFGMSGLITLMTRSIPHSLRTFAIVEPFGGIVATFGGIWATRYLHPSFSWLVSASGGLMAFAFAIQCYAVLRELLAARQDQRSN